MLHRTSCGCEKNIGASKAHTPQTCEHGSLYRYTKALGSNRSTTNGTPSSVERKPRKGMKRSQPKRDWSAARAKVELEGRCRVCGYEGEELEAAHVLGRKYDRALFEGAKSLYVDPDSIVPLCGVMTGRQCHREYDQHRLDLLPHLTAEEQARAVLDAGGIELARKRLCPSAYQLEEEVA